MFPKLSIPLIATLVLCAGVARAVPEAEFSAVVPAVPNSLDDPDRQVVTRAPKTEGLDEFESSSPDGVDHAHRVIATEKISDADFLELEFGNPELR